MKRRNVLRCFLLLCVIYTSEQTDECSDIINDVSGRYTIYDVNSCETDIMESNPNCPDLECENSDCLFGFAKDSSGCMTCDCVPDGEEGLYEGDIVLTEETKDYLRASLDHTSLGRVKRGATANRLLWNQVRQGNNYLVPYTISRAIDQQGINAINDAIADFDANTCIRLIPRTNEAEYLDFVNGAGCRSPVGRNQMQDQPNTITLGNGCRLKGTAIHEILHSLGFWHEQSRPDRDRHVIVNLRNVPLNDRHNFDRFLPNEIDSLGSPYDVGSIMHYGSHFFARAPGLLTITDLRRNRLQTQETDFAQTDIDQLNLLYGCQAQIAG